jgi:hypothetical protein
VTAPLPDDLLRDIEEKAKAATPGPWRASGEYYLLEFVADVGALVISAPGQRVSQADRAANAAYLEAVSPDVVLSLVERLRKAEAVKKAWAEQNAHIEHATRCETSRQHYGARADGWPDLLDPRCDCGLRELVLALEAL